MRRAPFLVSKSNAAPAHNTESKVYVKVEVTSTNDSLSNFRVSATVEPSRHRSASLDPSSDFPALDSMEIICSDVYELYKSGEGGIALMQLHFSDNQKLLWDGHMRLEVESSLPEDKLMTSTVGDGGVIDSIGIVGARDLSKGVETNLGGVDKLDL